MSSSEFKVCKPVVIGKSKFLRRFRKLPNPSKPYGMLYFHNNKAWMATEIMIQVILTALDCKLDFENRKVLLFLDNAPSHSETLQGKLKSIQFVFLTKNNTSQLQPCDAVIIRNFRVKYRM